MQQRRLGRSGLNIAPLVFGGNVFGWTVDAPRAFALLDRFVDQGFNAIDTADMYPSWAPGCTGGESEAMIGDWLARRGRRDDVVLMTKVGMWETHKGLSAANIAAAVDASLARLRTDHLDVYFAHLDDTAVPLEETLTAFGKLVQAGKVRALGASNYDAARLREALDLGTQLGLPRYEVVQPRYNLHDRADFESGLAALAQARDLGVVSYFSLASGFLTGKYHSVADVEGSARASFLRDYFDTRGLKVLEALRQVAAELAATPAQVALAWLMARPGVTAPIASATSVAQLDDIMAAVRLTLPPEVMAVLDAAGL